MVVLLQITNTNYTSTCAVLYLEKKYGMLQNMGGQCTPYAKELGRYL